MFKTKYYLGVYEGDSLYEITRDEFFQNKFRKVVKGRRKIIGYLC